MRKIYALALLSLFISTCKKDTQAPIIIGIYEGSFQIVNERQSNSISEIQVEFSGETFKVLKGRRPAHGIFRFEKENQVYFENRSGVYADFDWREIRSGSYHFKAKKDSITLTAIQLHSNETKILPTTLFQYKLKKKV